MQRRIYDQTYQQHQKHVSSEQNMEPAEAMLRK